MNPNVVDNSEVRHLWPLEPGRVFTNHGSYGACPLPVLQAQRELKQRLESAPSDFMNRIYPQLLKAARDRIAEFLVCSPQDLAMVTNATSGVNAVLGSLSWQPGDEILLTDHGYAACANVVSHLAQRFGIRPVTVALPFPTLSPQEVVQSVLQAVTPRTRLALLCHVTSPTAFLFPLPELARQLSARGVEVLVDGAHAVGMTDLNLAHLAEDGVTYYTGNFHKWCCSPRGAAFLWVCRAKQALLHPCVISHGFAGPVEVSRFLQEFDWCGTFDPTAWLTVPAALDFLENLQPGGWPGYRKAGRALLLQARLTVARALPEQTFVDEGSLGLMASLELPPSVEPREFYERLYDDFRIDSWTTRWNGRTLLRLSAAPYNTLQDYDCLRQALAKVLPSDPGAHS